MANDDAFDIVNLVNLYPIAVDSLQFELFDEIFTETAHVDFGGPAQWNDLVSLKRDFAAVHTPYKATQHNTGNHRVKVSGNTAKCLSYVNARFIRDVEEGDNMFQASGWYDDVLTRTVDGWRIARRINRTFWSSGNPRVMETLPGVTVELQHNALSAEAAAGHVMYFQTD